MFANIENIRRHGSRSPTLVISIHYCARCFAFTEIYFYIDYSTYDIHSGKIYPIVVRQTNILDIEYKSCYKQPRYFESALNNY